MIRNVNFAKTTNQNAPENLLTTQPDLSALDVRTPAEFAEVRVPQAQHQVVSPAAIAKLRKGGLM